MTKMPPRVDATRIGTKKIEFQLELETTYPTRQDIDTMSESISDVIQQSASKVAKGGVTRTSASYEALVRVPRTRHSYENMSHVVVAKQSSRESCVNDVIR